MPWAASTCLISSSMTSGILQGTSARPLESLHAPRLRTCSANGATASLLGAPPPRDGTGGEEKLYYLRATAIGAFHHENGSVRERVLMCGASERASGQVQGCVGLSPTVGSGLCCNRLAKLSSGFRFIFFNSLGLYRMSSAAIRDSW